MIIRLNHPAELKVDQCHKSGDIWFGKVKGDSSIDPLLTGSHKHFIIGAIRLFGFSYLWRPPLPWHFNGRRAQLKPSIYEPGDKIFHPRTQSPFNIHPSSFFGGRENMFPCFVIFLVRWILIYLLIYLFIYLMWIEPTNWSKWPTRLFWLLKPIETSRRWAVENNDEKSWEINYSMNNNDNNN